MKTHYSFFVLLFLFSAFSSFAQQEYYAAPTDSIYILTLKDGSQIFGMLKSKNDSAFVIESKTMGTVSIKRSNIEELTVTTSASFKEGKYWFPNPNSTRYFFSPSGIPLKTGEGYYQNIFLIFNQFNVGVTDFLSLGAGFDFLTLFNPGSGGGPIFTLNAKAACRIADNLYAGAGVFYLNVPDGGRRTGLALPFAVGTYGNKDYNFTIGAGLGHDENGWGESPIYTISGMARLARRSAFVTETWVIPVQHSELHETYNPGTGYFTYYSTSTYTHPAEISFGIRFFGEKISVDVAMVSIAEGSNGRRYILPYVDLVVKF